MGWMSDMLAKIPLLQIEYRPSISAQTWERIMKQKIKMHPRLVREWTTIEKMSFLYCQAYHQSPKGTLCSECRDLYEYAGERLRKCPFQENKSTCANCAIHCYKPDRRAQIRKMMRYAGPRMLLHHPILAVLHLLDGRRKTPLLKRRPTQSKKSD